MTGRPINEDRKTAIDLGFKTYQGLRHPACGTTERYTKGGGCVKCARVIATEQREARNYLKRVQASINDDPTVPLDSAPEGLYLGREMAQEPDVPEDAEARREASIDDLM